MTENAPSGGRTPAKEPAATPEQEPEKKLEPRSLAQEDAARLQLEADKRIAEEDQIDETIPGGAYVVDGQWVDAEGKPLKQEKAEPARG